MNTEKQKLSPTIKKYLIYTSSQQLRSNHELTLIHKERSILQKILQIPEEQGIILSPRNQKSNRLPLQAKRVAPRLEDKKSSTDNSPKHTKLLVDLSIYLVK
jgi:hypothetical protein